MSRPRHPSDLFPGDPSGDFGRDEGMLGYAILAEMNPDARVDEIAALATRIAMLVERRFDINPELAAKAIMAEMTPDSIIGEPDLL